MMGLPLRTGSTSHILLYHATFSHVPRELLTGLHNVTPAELERQLSWLKQHFRFIPLDEWFESTNRRGTAVVTFDDAYNSVFAEALPVLESLDIPATVFVNGCTLDGKHFWRDKIRYILAHDMTRDFLDWLPADHALKPLTNEDEYYSKTKSPALNSRSVDTALDAYLADRDITLPRGYCADEGDRLIAHPLLTYGNHTYSHYVLSALTHEEQAVELGRNQDLLSSLGLPLSRVLSIPFGGCEHFNYDTLGIAQELGYCGYVLARNRLAGSVQDVPDHSLQAADRYMPPPTLRLHRLLALKLAYLQPVRSLLSGSAAGSHLSSDS